MKKILAIAALASLAATAHAQLSPVPPSSALDGVNVQNGSFGAPLSDYYFASDGNLNDPNMDSPDNVDGLSWSHSVNSSAASNLALLNASGGTIRAIFTGESAGWFNNFGYTYNDVDAASSQNSSSNSFTLFNSVQAVAGPDKSISSGAYADINLSKGAASTFDFWLDGVGNASNPTQFGGVYNAIDQSASVPYELPGNVLWATTAIEVPTWVAADNATELVATYLVGFEDWQLNNGSDKDYNDFMFAIQLYKPDGTPFTPVPEPSTYGLIGAAALLGLVARRRFAAKK